MRSAYIGIDVAIAKNKFLPIAICTWNNGRFVPEAVRQLALVPPRGMGNAATLDDTAVRRFVRDARTYIIAACERLAVEPTRIGIDAPSSLRRPQLVRRRAEAALDRAGISCFTTPSEVEFSAILGKVARHLERRGGEDRIPHANQLWMRVGFALFAELSQLAPCLEVFPQATARISGCGSIHKSQPGAVALNLPPLQHSLVGRPKTATRLWQQSLGVRHTINWMRTFLRGLLDSMTTSVQPLAILPTT